MYLTAYGGNHLKKKEKNRFALFNYINRSLKDFDFSVILIMLLTNSTMYTYIWSRLFERRLNLIHPNWLKKIDANIVQHFDRVC